MEQTDTNNRTGDRRVAITILSLHAFLIVKRSHFEWQNKQKVWDNTEMVRGNETERERERKEGSNDKNSSSSSNKKMIKKWWLDHPHYLLCENTVPSQQWFFPFASFSFHSIWNPYSNKTMARRCGLCVCVVSVAYFFSSPCIYHNISSVYVSNDSNGTEKSECA